MAALRAPKQQSRHRQIKKNPLKNPSVMGRLNPSHKVMVKAAKELEARRKRAKATKLEAKRTGKPVPAAKGAKGVKGAKKAPAKKK